MQDIRHTLPLLVPARFFRDIPLRPGYILLALILVLATARRLFALDRDSLWSDELWGVYACSLGSWWAMIQDLIHNDSHPPGYQTLLYWWMFFFGKTDTTIRLPSVAAGIVTIAATFALGRRHFSMMTGLIAAAIVSGSYQAVYFSQEARAYAFLMMLSPLCVLGFIELFVKGDRRLQSLLLFWLASTAMIYMHYVGFVFIGSAMLLWLVLRASGRLANPALHLALRAFAPCLLLYAPWLPVMYHHMAHSPDAWTTPAPDLPALWKTLRFLLGPDDTRLWLYLISLIAMHAVYAARQMAMSFSALEKLHRQNKLLIFSCLLWFCLCPWAVFYLKSQLSQSVYTLRHFTYAIPLLALLSACLPAVLIRQMHSWRWRTLALSACLAGIITLSQHGNMEHRVYGNRIREDYRGAIDVIRYDKTFMKQDNVHFIAANNAFFDHYLAMFHIKERADFYLDNPGNIPQLAALLKEKGASRFYYVTAGGGEIPAVALALAQQFEARCYSRLNRMHVLKFAVRPPPDQTPLSELHDCPLKSMTRPFRDQYEPAD